MRRPSPNTSHSTRACVCPMSLPPEWTETELVEFLIHPETPTSRLSRDAPGGRAASRHTPRTLPSAWDRFATARESLPDCRQLGCPSPSVATGARTTSPPRPPLADPSEPSHGQVFSIQSSASGAVRCRMNLSGSIIATPFARARSGLGRAPPADAPRHDRQPDQARDSLRRAQGKGATTTTRSCASGI